MCPVAGKGFLLFPYPRTEAVARAIVWTEVLRCRIEEASAASEQVPCHIRKRSELTFYNTVGTDLIAGF